MKKPLVAGVLIFLFALLSLVFLVCLPEIFSGRKQLESVAFTIFNLSVKWYGILIALGALSAYFFISLDAKCKKLDKNIVESAILVALIFGLIGARAGFIIQNIPHFLSFPAEIFNTRMGGLSIHGALVLGLIALYFYLRKTKKIVFSEIINLISPSVLIAIAIGRWGNLFNYEIIGRPTNVWWGMFVPLQYRPDKVAQYEFFHPVFLYESLLLVVLFIFYRIFLARKDVGFIYAFVGYCLVRIIVEFFRIDYHPIFVGFDLAQIVSFVIIISVVLINKKMGSKNGKSRTVYS